MPDIGFLELILVGAIAFLVLGPERMPELFAQIGRVVKKGRGWIDDVRRQVDAETAPLKAQLHEVEDAVGGGVDHYNESIMNELGQTLEPEHSDSKRSDFECAEQINTQTETQSKANKKRDHQ